MIRILVIIGMVLVLLLSACSSEQQPEKTQDNIEGQSVETKLEDFTKDRLISHGKSFDGSRALTLSGANLQSDNPIIQVKLINYLGNVKELTVSTSGSYRVGGDLVVDPNKTYKLKVENGSVSLYDGAKKVREGSSITFQAACYSEENVIQINSRKYLGTVEFTSENGFIRPVNTLPVEEYLKGVISHEMPASWDLDALKVQTVAARTYALSQASKVIDDSINYQVYAGYAWHPNSTRAVNETKGEILEYNKKLALTVYSSSNGGHTESNANIWGGASLPYFPVKEDPYDPVHPWSFRFQKLQLDLTDKDLHQPDMWWGSSKEVDTAITSNLKSWLGRNGYANREIKIHAIPRLSFSNQRTSGERVISGDMTVQFLVKANNSYVTNEDGSIKIHTLELKGVPAQQIRSMIGINFIRTYYIDQVTDQAGTISVAGRGFGHGVGMSQWGAKQMADRDMSYREILLFYYPGTEIVRLNHTGPAEVGEKKSFQIKLTVDKKQATVNGELVQLSEAPFIRNSRTLVPLRFVSERLGSHVDWNNTTREITITSANKTLLLKGGSKAVAVNGKNVTIDVAPDIIRGTTFVPLRFISEQIGAEVEWLNATRTITITR